MIAARRENLTKDIDPDKLEPRYVSVSLPIFTLSANEGRESAALLDIERTSMIPAPANYCSRVGIPLIPEACTVSCGFNEERGWK
jgi:hypothetical protein